MLTVSPTSSVQTRYLRTLLLFGPGHSEFSGRFGFDMCAKSSVLSVERLLQPSDVLAGCSNQAKATYLKGYDLKLDQFFTNGIEAGGIQQREIAPVFLITGDAFIVVEEITAPIQNQSVPVNFDCLCVM